MKEKLDFKLINIALIVVILYLIYKSSSLWINILDKLFKIFIPLFVGFTLSYAVYPVLSYLKKYKIPKFLGIFLIVLFIILVITSIILLLIPIVIKQVPSLIEYLNIFLNNINMNHLINKINNYITDNAFKTITFSITFITNFIMIFVLFIYFLIDMEKIRYKFKTLLSNKLYNYFKLIDSEMKKYLNGFIKIIFITFFEYTFLYCIIGHPNALLLGFLSTMGNFIPYFGGIIVQTIAVITSLTISSKLGIIVAISTFIFGLIDSYIINPLVYGKSNEISSIVIIISIFAGSILFGFIGIVISLPLSIIITNTIKFIKKENKY